MYWCKETDIGRCCGSGVIWIPGFSASSRPTPTEEWSRLTHKLARVPYAHKTELCGRRRSTRRQGAIKIGDILYDELSKSVLRHDLACPFRPCFKRLHRCAQRRGKYFRIAIALPAKPDRQWRAGDAGERQRRYRQRAECGRFSHTSHRRSSPPSTILLVHRKAARMAG